MAKYVPYEASPTKFCTVLSMPKIQNGFTNRLTNNKKIIFFKKRLFIRVVNFPHYN